MKITLSTTNNTYLLGWYGTSNDTEPYDLGRIAKYIHSVHKIANDNYSWEMYKPTNEQNDFTHLEVGNIYYLNFYSVSQPITFEILNLFSSSGNIEDFDRGVLEGVEDLDDETREEVEYIEDDIVEPVMLETEITTTSEYDDITQSSGLTPSPVTMSWMDDSNFVVEPDTPISEFQG